MGEEGGGSPTEPPLEGSHRPHVGRWQLLVLPFWLAAIGAYAIGYRHDWSKAGFWMAYATFMAFGAYFGIWGPRTVVQPSALRIRPYLKWQTVPWADIREIAGPGRWDPQNVITVTTREGQKLALPGLPASRLAELTEYAEQHGKTAT